MRAGLRPQEGVVEAFGGRGFPQAAMGRNKQQPPVKAQITMDQYTFPATTEGEAGAAGSPLKSTTPRPDLEAILKAIQDS
ncbi:hypothetical protein NDU88_002747 [Pleurodeles waltl]|uniref:Uncharacterized protein n=1 Tax=Pleurodeles waltl TaxID=8319 RepID=A0AAV7LDA9_PLEWA|nr:hypothetical protein NDU88_002747 [Pleurodeles waltl]